MPSGIQEHDKGYLASSEAWHHDERYIITGTEPVTYEQAASVANIPVAKIPLYQLLETTQLPVAADDGTPGVVDINDIRTIDGAFAVVRTDLNLVLAPMVGRAYHPTPHLEILNWVNEILLKVYPQLAIMGTGTLMNGAQYFLQLQAKEFFVHGDESACSMKLLYGQHYGVSAHICAAVVERVVCKNTWKMAISEADLSGKLQQHKHTRNAAAEVTKDLDMMGNLYLQLDKHVELLEGFVAQAVDTAFLTKFLDAFYPLAEKAGRSQTMALNHRQAITAGFESQALADTLAPFARNTRYSLWQAFSGHVDHDGSIRNGDELDKDWDCRLGTRADFKTKAFKFLATGETAPQIG